MKYKLATSGVVAAALVLSTLSLSGIAGSSADAATAPTTWPLADYDKSRPSDNVILKWNQQLLATITANPAGTGPTVTARALGVLQTATYDAWAAYDPVAKGTRLGPATAPSRRTHRGEQGQGHQLRRVQDAELALPGAREHLQRAARRVVSGSGRAGSDAGHGR